VRTLKVGDIDLERKQLHVRQGKGSKDRILPIGNMLKRGLQDYINSQRPQCYLFEGTNGGALSQRGAQWTMSEAVKKAGIIKEDVSLHTLRHTFATHLLEQGISILVIKELLGHAHIDTTMIYLHLARPVQALSVSTLDTLYKQPKP
jgi:site-specific recombinase XerD